MFNASPEMSHFTYHIGILTHLQRVMFMLKKLTKKELSAFAHACTYERVFGSKAMTALRAYGLESQTNEFYLCVGSGGPTAALYLRDGVLAVSTGAQADVEEIAALIRQKRVGEVDINWPQCEVLQAILGGVTESSYYMVYAGGPQKPADPDIRPGTPSTVFDVLQQSHEYYRTHLKYESWAADLERKLRMGLMELYQLEQDGKVVGTGSIASEDDECGVIAAVAVIPEYRHLGLGSRISRFLVGRIQEKGKTPRLISGYDEVAELYRKIGFVPCGRWGELYL